MQLISEGLLAIVAIPRKPLVAKGQVIILVLLNAEQISKILNGGFNPRKNSDWRICST